MTLDQLASRAREDANRARDLETAIQILGMNPDVDNLEVSISFNRTSESWKAGKEVERMILSTWENIRGMTLATCQLELEVIKARYADLLREEQQS